MDRSNALARHIVRARALIGLALFATLLVAPVARADDDVGLITGGEKGTYYQFGLDLQRLMKSNGFNLTVHPSRGSVDNVYAVYQKPGVQMGIVQSDVLAFVSRVESDPLLRRIARKTKMVFPLYNEEVHLVGRPREAFKDDVSVGDQLALIPITHKSIVEFYPSVSIPGDVYAWQSTPVPTVAVKSVLVSFDFRRRDCQTVGRFAGVLASKMSWLTANGHPKWKAVDLEYPLKGWEQYDCVRRAMGKAPATATARGGGGDNPISDAIKNILGD